MVLDVNKSLILINTGEQVQLHAIVIEITKDRLCASPVCRTITSRRRGVFRSLRR